MYKFEPGLSSRILRLLCRQTVCEFFYANNFTLKALDKKPHRKNYGLRRLLRTA